MLKNVAIPFFIIRIGPFYNCFYFERVSFESFSSDFMFQVDQVSTAKNTF